MALRMRRISRSRTILIAVKSDSMINPGIHAGEIAVVEKATCSSKRRTRLIR